MESRISFMPYFKNNYNTKKANEEKYEETKVKTIEYIKKATHPSF